MKTVDIHTHLLNSDVKFNRIYDKLALKFFGKKMGIDATKMINEPYNAYVDAIVNNARTSKYTNKIVLFGVDERVDDMGKTLHKDITVCATNDDVLKVYQDNPNEIIPFFSINPKRPDALDLIDKYYNLGFKGAKFLQNYWGVNTNEPRYEEYFKKLASLDLPIIVHIGSESSVHSFKDCETLDMLNAPLKAGVKTIAAHMALSYSPWNLVKAFSKNPNNFNEEYHTLLKMLETNENLYADISALLTPVRAKVLPHLSKQTQIHHKLLYGTDFPVPFTTLLNSYDLPYKKRLEFSKILNPSDRYAKVILEYFKEDNPIYTNYKKVLKDV